MKVTPTGRCTFPGLRKTGSFDLFWPNKKGDPNCDVHLWWEWLIQAGIIVELIKDFGYPESRISIDLGPFDVVIHDEEEAATPLIAVETKDSAAKLRNMLNEMQTPQTAIQNSSRKATGLFEMSPRYFWAVAPELRSAYRLTKVEDFIELREVPRIPRFGEKRVRESYDGRPLRISKPTTPPLARSFTSSRHTNGQEVASGVVAQATVSGFNYRWAIEDLDHEVASVRMAWRERQKPHNRWIGPVYQTRCREVPVRDIQVHRILMESIPPERSIIDLEW
jgi:hypothetical protein